MAEEEQDDLYENMEEDINTTSEEATDFVSDGKDKKPGKIQGLESLPGVGAATAEKLRLAGFDTVMAIAVATPGELVNAAGISEVVARKLIQASRSSIDMGFESAEDILKKREQVIRLSTGSNAFDTILAGGFETGAITECYGQYGSSKTQVAHQLCVNMIKQIPDAVAVYLDTENTFRPERIIQFAKGVGLDPERVLKQIKVARAYNSDHQMVLAEQVEELITKKNLNVKLIVVDSLTAHFRAEYVGRGTLADRQQKLNKHMHVLAKLADVYNLCVYVTNQVMARPDQFFGDPTESIGGHIVGHNSTFRIYLRKGKKGTRVAKLLDAPNLADAEAVFVVKEEGIRDV
ncbi:DNA repair and recombination protein RadA [Candidatus Woesearchaeota archaeon]|nr:DNA repair and recombination protein RadA [Candidatus Woesearchaeota archaeon]